MNDFAHGGAEAAADAFGGDDAAHIGFFDVEFREFEEGMVGHVVAEGVEVGDEVAELAVGVDEVGDLHEAAGAFLELGGVLRREAWGGGRGRLAAGGCAGELKACEEIGPLGVDGLAVLFGGLVLAFDEFDVAGVDGVYGNDRTRAATRIVCIHDRNLHKRVCSLHLLSEEAGYTIARSGGHDNRSAAPVLSVR